jgi:hypothetical protein
MKLLKKLVSYYTQKNEACSAASINDKINQLELTLGLLDAAFYHLNIPYPTDDEKIKASCAV